MLSLLSVIIDCFTKAQLSCKNKMLEEKKLRLYNLPFSVLVQIGSQMSVYDAIRRLKRNPGCLLGKTTK